ncbi:MAG: choice-of-anchor D domain-containing protein [Nitrospirota bacterium]
MRRMTLLYLAVIAFAVMVSWTAPAGAFEQYSSDGTTGNCADCHGNFLAATYSSLAAAKASNPAWPGSLHNVHRNGSTATPPGMLNNNCNACHSGASRSPVPLGFSAAAAPFNRSCTGCHDGAGLRLHHERSGAAVCSDCHSDAQGREDTLPPVYTAALGTTSGTTRVNDPCSPAAAGFEGRLADVSALGLDNDGDLLYDLSDPDCAPPAAPQISAAPTALSFGTVTVGSNASRDVTISNAGNAPLNVTPSLCAGTSTEYTASPAAAFTVPAAGSMALTVTYTPADAGTDAGCVALAHNAATTASPLNVNVTGAGEVLQPVLSVSPLSTTFPDTQAGMTATQTVTAANTGNATLTGNASIPAGAAFSVAPASFSIPAGGAPVVLTVTFAPLSAGAFSATMAVASNGGTADVALAGNGLGAPPPQQPAITVTPAAVDFGSVQTGATAAQSVTVANTGNALLTGNVSIPAGTPFSVTPASFSIPAGGAPVVLTVTFAPLSAGNFSSTMTVASNDPANPSIAVDLSGSGITPPPQAPALQLSPASLNLGTVAVGGSATLTTQIRNTGNAPLEISLIALCSSTSPEFSWSPAVPPAITVAPGTNTVLSVTYTPADAGTDTGCLAVSSNDPAQPAANLDLSAAGFVPSPSQVDIDIEEFKAKSRIDICPPPKEPNPIRPSLVAENEGKTGGCASANVTGMQNDVEVYSQTIEICLPPDEERRFTFPGFMPTEASTIVWTVTVNDGDPDADAAMATTRVVCKEKKEKDGKDKDD